MREPPRLLEVVVRPAAQLGDPVGREELRRAALGRQVPHGRLGAVLAELEEVRLGRLGPGAGGAHVPARLVLAIKRAERARRGPLIGQHLGYAPHRSPAAGRVVVEGQARVLPGRVLGHACQSPQPVGHDLVRHRGLQDRVPAYRPDHVVHALVGEHGGDRHRRRRHEVGPELLARRGVQRPHAIVHRRADQHDAPGGRDRPAQRGRSPGPQPVEPPLLRQPERHLVEPLARVQVVGREGAEGRLPAGQPRPVRHSVSSIP
jgi:hypothetical protein